VLQDVVGTDDVSYLEEGIVTAIENFLLETGVFVLGKDAVKTWKTVEFDQVKKDRE